MKVFVVTRLYEHFEDLDSNGIGVSLFKTREQAKGICELYIKEEHFDFEMQFEDGSGIDTINEELETNQVMTLEQENGYGRVTISFCESVVN